MASVNDKQVLVRIDKRGKQGQVAYITLNNARRLNSMNSQLMREFIEKVTILCDNRELRVVVLAGAGERSFIGGADIFELKDLDPPGSKDFLTLVHGMCHVLRMLPVPVIARIHGYCLGAGPEVTTACDMRIASEDAIFGMPEVKVGLPSVVEAALLPQLIGWGKAKVLCYTGENISAQEALAWGLVEKVVPRRELDEAVESWITSILEAGPQAIRLQKELFRYWEQMPISDAIQEGIRSIAKAYETDEPHRMITAKINEMQKGGAIS